jgi:tungstate transport system ATP-binding protein
MRAPATDLPILFQQVSVRAREVTILNEIDLELGPGKPTLLLGPNGSGKTTLMRVAMGLTVPSHGLITWGGKADTNSGRRAFVFQRPVMLRRSAAANIDYALGAHGVDRNERARRVGDLLRRVGLEPLASRPARRLSGGEQQRLALARALAGDPEILFLDEPTTSLDPASAKAVEDIIRSVAASGIKVVMATHDLGQARRLAGDIVFLVRGRVGEHAPAERFFTSPATTEAAAFLRGDIVI